MNNLDIAGADLWQATRTSRNPQVEEKGWGAQNQGQGPRGQLSSLRLGPMCQIFNSIVQFSDAARLLSFYQLWLDDLFPKAKFLDALAMVEKAGHKKRLMIARNDFINEGKVKETAEDDEADEDPDADPFAPPREEESETVAAPVEPPRTPPQNDIPDDDDLYDATPRVSRPVVPIRNDMPDEDDLDALIAEAEGQDQAQMLKPAAAEPEDDDLDALIAEAEEQDRGPPPRQQSKDRTGQSAGQDFADEEAAMQEMEGLW